MTGIKIVMVDIALSLAQNSPSCVINEAIYTGKVFAFIAVRLTAKKNSFQINTKVSSADYIIPDFERGKIILKKALNLEHPSISAASKISIGISLKNDVTIHIINGV